MKKDRCRPNWSPAGQSYDLSKAAEERLRDLEQDLQFTHENLQATIEELETSNEELQATNEELLASNEELQSTNEELQSTNEELFTVNTEYQSKIIELTELNNDVENLLGATQIGHLLLDENLEVRRFSPRIAEIFKLLESDVGRPITHISHYLANCDPHPDGPGGAGRRPTRGTGGPHSGGALVPDADRALHAWDPGPSPAR
ncbi:MAG: PAS domain-containing protein [Candidatus Competibacter sp.]